MDIVNAVYVREAVPPGFNPSVNGRCPARAVTDWVELTLPVAEDGEATAQTLSEQVHGPVIWVRARTAASELCVLHCEGGRVLRRIEFNNGACRSVAGKAQLWEGWLLENAEVEEAMDVSDPKGAAALKAAVERKTLAVGDELPWPREWEVIPYVLGTWQDEWRSARKKPPFTSFEGRRQEKKGSGLTTGALLGLWVCLFGLSLHLNSLDELSTRFWVISTLMLVASALYFLPQVRRFFRRVSSR